MKYKKITIEDLARMVKKGFDGTDKKIERGFKEVNIRFDRIENFILKSLTSAFGYYKLKIV